MLEFIDFYDIAVYGNEHWKGSFTNREIAQNAYDYFCEYLESIKNGSPTKTITTLITLLKEDNSNESIEWLDKIEQYI